MSLIAINLVLFLVVVVMYLNCANAIKREEWAWYDWCSGILWTATTVSAGVAIYACLVAFDVL